MQIHTAHKQSRKAKNNVGHISGQRQQSSLFAAAFCKSDFHSCIWDEKTKPINDA